MEQQKETRILPVELTDQEINERGLELAKIGSKIADLEDEIKRASKEGKDQLNAWKCQEQSIRKAILTGRENRDVECTIEYDYVHAKVVTTRDDTGDQIDTRPMTKDEMQLEIPSTRDDTGDQIDTRPMTKDEMQLEIPSTGRRGRKKASIDSASIDEVIS